MGSRLQLDSLDKSSGTRTVAGGLFLCNCKPGVASIRSKANFAFSVSFFSILQVDLSMFMLLFNTEDNSNTVVNGSVCFTYTSVRRSFQGSYVLARNFKLGFYSFRSRYS